MLQMNNDIDRLRSILASVGYDSDHVEGDKIADATIAVLLTLSTFDLSEDAKKTVRNLMSTRFEADVSTLPYQFTEDSWQDFDYGNVTIGSYVRVKKDAYDSESGARHNGLVGRLLFMKGGSCSVEYIGLATGNTMKHPMDKIESLKRSVQ
jgi:hypothetical protein